MDFTDPDQARSTEAARTEIAETGIDVRGGCLIALTVMAVFYTLYFAADFVLPLLIAIILNLLLQPARHFLCHRLRFPAPLASVVLILAMVGVFGGLVFAISRPASTWIAKAPESLPLLEKKFGGLREPIAYIQHGFEQVQEAVSGKQKPSDAPSGTAANPEKVVSVQQSSAMGNISSIGGVGLSVLSTTKAALAQVFTVIVILFFLLSSGGSLLRRLVEIVPKFADKKRVVDIGIQIERNVAGYLATITVMNLLVGVANGISAWACGLPDPLLWGVLAFLLNYIPILGPVVGITIFFLVGLFVYDQLVWAFLPAGIYLVVHILEGETITPMLLASRFTLNPVMVIVSLFFWDFLWGIPGALLAVPLLAVIKIVCDRIGPLTPVGHMLGGPPGSQKRVAKVA